MAKIEGIVPDINKNAKKCRCPGFPTPNECIKGNDECLFCSKYTGYDIEKKGLYLWYIVQYEKNMNQLIIYY